MSGEDVEPVTRFRDLLLSVDEGRTTGTRALQRLPTGHPSSSAVDEVAGHLARTSTRTLVRDSPVEPLRRPRSRAGVTTRAVSSAHSGHWIASARRRELRHGRVPLELALVDDAMVVVAGWERPDGSRVLWGVTSPELVGLARLLWQRAWAQSDQCTHPVLTLSERQVEIAALVTEGLTIRGIARAVGASERVVSTELNLLTLAFGARDRASLVFRMCATPPQWPLGNRGDVIVRGRPASA